MVQTKEGLRKVTNTYLHPHGDTSVFVMLHVGTATSLARVQLTPTIPGGSSRSRGGDGQAQVLPLDTNHAGQGRANVRSASITLGVAARRKLN